MDSRLGREWQERRDSRSEWEWQERRDSRSDWEWQEKKMLFPSSFVILSHLLSSSFLLSSPFLLSSSSPSSSPFPLSFPTPILLSFPRKRESSRSLGLDSRLDREWQGTVGNDKERSGMTAPLREWQETVRDDRRHGGNDKERNIRNRKNSFN